MGTRMETEETRRPAREFSQVDTGTWRTPESATAVYQRAGESWLVTLPPETGGLMWDCEIPMYRRLEPFSPLHPPHPLLVSFARSCMIMFVSITYPDEEQSPRSWEILSCIVLPNHYKTLHPTSSAHQALRHLSSSLRSAVLFSSPCYTHACVSDQMLMWCLPSGYLLQDLAVSSRKIWSVIMVGLKPTKMFILHDEPAGKFSHAQFARDFDERECGTGGPTITWR